MYVSHDCPIVNPIELLMDCIMQLEMCKRRAQDQTAKRSGGEAKSRGTRRSARLAADNKR